MVTVYDVPANKLIEKTAKELEKMGIKKPDFVNYMKSGVHADRRPTQKDFWYLRLASILRQTYVKNKVGVNSLRKHYGGRKNRGRRKSHHRNAAGSIIRRGLQTLEEQKLIKKDKVGRSLTGKGRALLDKMAYDISQN